MKKTSFRRSFLLTTLALTLVACGQQVSPPINTASPAEQQAIPGTLSVTLEGLPSGAEAALTVSGGRPP